MEKLILNYVRLAGIALLVPLAMDLGAGEVNVMSVVAKMELPGV